jgi:hypothetical protein
MAFRAMRRSRAASPTASTDILEVEIGYGGTAITNSKGGRSEIRCGTLRYQRPSGGGQSRMDPTAGKPDMDVYSWNTFIAVNWPADTSTCRVDRNQPRIRKE